MSINDEPNFNITTNANIRYGYRTSAKSPMYRDCRPADYNTSNFSPRKRFSEHFHVLSAATDVLCRDITLAYDEVSRALQCWGLEGDQGMDVLGVRRGR
jgi:hypothetical protein